MRHVQSDHPAGTVIVPTSGNIRYIAFYMALERLAVPAGTRLLLTESSELARALNDALAQMHGEWVWFVGDDHEFEPDLVMRLLGYNLPMVGPLNIQRIRPFGPVLLRGPSQAESVPITWDEVPTGGGLWALPADMYTGQSGLLVRKSVLDLIERPVFRIGQYQPDRLNEDFYFNAQLRAQGVPHVIDTGVVMGHINSFSLGAAVNDGEWRVTVSRNGHVHLAARV